MKRILFVDDDLPILESLRDNLRKQRGRWEMVFVNSAHAALAELEKAPFDIVVTDMQMPVTDGATLLGQIRERHPRIMRLILSGQADRELVLRAIPVAHQFLSKPCEPIVLRETLERLCALQDLVDDDAIRVLLGERRALPSLPRIHTELTHAIAQPRASSLDLAQIVEQDPPLAAKLLQLANSAFFGLPRQTSTVQAAIAYLGVDLLKVLALTADVFVSLERATSERSLAEALQQRAVSVARLAQRFAPDPKTAELAFSAGLLSNLGMMLVALKMPERAQRIISTAANTGKPWHVVEAEEGGPGYAAIGAYLLGAWGLPLELVEAVAYQHFPSAAPQRCPLEVLLTLHVATTLVESIAAGASDPLARVDRSFAARARILDKLPSFLSIAQQELSTAPGTDQ